MRGTLRHFGAGPLLLGVHRDRRVERLVHGDGPPPRVDGHGFGVNDLPAGFGHGAERHPDGDEVLHVVSGRVRVVLEDPPEAPVELGPGETAVVPRGR